MTTMEASSSVAPTYSTSSSLHIDSSNATQISPPSKASGSTPKTTTLNRRQHAAQRARIMALSKQLTTRLQYATFKVEHGWSKQSLSEVENLYYRHCKAVASSSSSLPNRSPSSVRKSSIPSTPKIPSKTAQVSMVAARHSLPGQGPEVDVFGGLMTPPASGGNFSSQAERESFAMNPSFTSGLMNRQRSPTAGLEGKGGSSAANKGKSYADFWSKIGTAGAGQGNERQ